MTANSSAMSAGGDRSHGRDIPRGESVLGASPRPAYITTPSLDILAALRLGDASIANLVADTGRRDRAVRLLCDRLVRVGWAVRSDAHPVRYSATPAGLAAARSQRPRKVATRRKVAPAKPAPDVLAYVRQGYRTVAEIAATSGRNRQTIDRWLRRLVRAGLVTVSRSQAAGAAGRPPNLFRIASAVVADGGRATGRDILRGEVTSSPSPRPTTTRTPNPRSTP